MSGGNAGRVANVGTKRNDVHQIISGVINATPYSMYDSPIHLSVWDIDYLIDAYKIVDYPKKTIGNTPAAASLIFADDARTEITGVSVDADGPCRVTVPASVEKIGFAAFAGKFNITEIVFEEGSRLTEIDDWAFGGTSVSKIEIPETVKKIGTGAFGDCIRLAKVSLPNAIESIGNAAFGNCGNIVSMNVPNVSAEIGRDVFDGGVLWIAEDKSEYDALTASGGVFEGQSTDVITYPITIEYVQFTDDGASKVVIDTERRLYLHPYKLICSDGKWVMTESNQVGTVKTRNYAGNLWWCKTADGSNLRIGVENLDKFLLNSANIINGIATVEARTGAAKIYIPKENIVYDKNISYGTVNPHNANSGGPITVAEANSLLADYSEKIPDTATVKVNTYTNGDGKGSGVPQEIRQAGTYTFTVTEADGKTYNFSVTIARRQVDLSLRENLDWKLSKIENVTSSIELLDDRGMMLYLYATAGGGQYPSLVPLSNAKLTQEQKNLGINETNYVIKTVRYSVVRSRGKDVEISIANREAFWVSHSGNRNSAVGAYTATAEIVEDDNYTIIRTGEIQDNAARGVKVTVAADGVTYTDPNDPSVKTECNPVNYEAVFRVTEASLPKSVSDAINGAIKGKEFVYDWDGYAHWYDDAAKTVIDNALASYAAPSRANTVWAQSIYDDLYGGIELTYNLMRLRNDVYYEYGNLAITAADPDKYSVYYKISAPNYKNSISDLTDETRTDYNFTVTIIREIALPSVGSAEYNGRVQKADIAGSEFYTVDAYGGFTDAGKYNITLTLVNPTYFRWEGKALGEAAVATQFEITKAQNEFTESPDVVRWIAGKFSKKENGFIGLSKFGEITYVITDTNDRVLYDASQGIDKRSSMKAGTYILKATVAGTESYNGLSGAFTVRIFDEEGMVWWAALLIALGALLVAAAVILVLWRKGVFRVVTNKLILSIKTRANVDATIASVRAAKRMEEGKKSVEAAKRREKAAERRRKAAEERAAALEAKAAAEEARIERLRAKSEAMRAKAERMRGESQPKAEDVMPEVAATVDASEKHTDEA